MNRRDFIKLCGVIAGSVCLPITAGTMKTAACAILPSGKVYSIREAAMLALGQWAREQIDKDMIMAVRGLIVIHDERLAKLIRAA